MTQASAARRIGGTGPTRGSARRKRSRATAVLSSAAAALVLTATGLADGARAFASTVRIEYPPNGGAINEVRPSLSGTAWEEEPLLEEPIVLRIYAGSALVQEAIAKPPFPNGRWGKELSAPLAQGAYTAVAEAAMLGGGQATSTFTVDTTPPQLAISSPAYGSVTTGSSQLVAGSTGMEAGDEPSVSVHVFAGEATVARAAVETLAVPISASGSWSTTVGGLTPGVYTVQAEQRDRAGNVGLSAAVKFTVSSPSAPALSPPVASFQWFPAAPQTGESISLASTSKDASNAITAYAWAPSASGPLAAGGPVLTTSFAAPGPHPVRLRVTDSTGRTSEVTETIPVAGRPLPLMLPVPIVRMAGSETSTGVLVNLLTVQAPVDAHVTVTCRGRGCPRRSESVVARASRRRKADAVQIAFPGFEHALRGGVVLEIRVSKPGEIGKYTRFAIRSHMLPLRVDSCLAALDPKPIVCPS